MPAAGRLAELREEIEKNTWCQAISDSKSIVSHGLAVHATMRGDLQCVKYLCGEVGVSVNAISCMAMGTPLLIAYTAKKDDIVRYLLSIPNDEKYLGGEGHILLHYLASGGSEDYIWELVLNFGFGYPRALGRWLSSNSLCFGPKT